MIDRTNYAYMLTLEEIQSILKIDESAAVRLINLREFQSLRFSRNTVRIPKAKFFNWLEERQTTSSYNELFTEITTNDIKTEIIEKEVVLQKVFEPAMNLSYFEFLFDCKKKYYPRGMDEIRVQNVIAKNLNKIEVGMRLIQETYKVSNGGVVDILARDQSGVLCAIEVKVNGDDGRIVFQSLSYEDTFNEKVRVILMSPYYSRRILEVLLKLNNAEIKTFTISGQYNKKFLKEVKSVN